MGGAFSVQKSQPRLISNNTILNNVASLQGGAFYIYDTSGVVILNSIFRNDSANGVLNEVSILNESTLSVQYSNIMGGWAGQGNIDYDPLFVGSGNHPYALSYGSLCIDSGTPDTTGLNLPPWDIIHNFRIWDGNEDGDTIVDMGSYEFDAPPWITINENLLHTYIENLELYVFPNPAQQELHISTDESVKITEVCIYSLTGQQVLQERPVDGTINISHLQPGMYIVEVTVENTRLRKKLLIQR